jgi:hypothetical protein
MKAQGIVGHFNLQKRNSVERFHANEIQEFIPVGNKLEASKAKCEMQMIAIWVYKLYIVV